MRVTTVGDYLGGLREDIRTKLDTLSPYTLVKAMELSLKVEKEFKIKIFVS